MNRLKELREGKGLKQKDMASFLGKTPQAYSLYELGQRNIDNNSLSKLASFFDVTIEYLLGVEDYSSGMANSEKTCLNHGSLTKKERPEIKKLLDAISDLDSEQVMMLAELVVSLRRK